MQNSTSVERRLIARVGAVCAAWAGLCAPALGQNWRSEEGPNVKVSEYGTVDLAVQDTDLAQVLEMLSIQGRKNIIASNSVSATVSANLYDVTFYEALDAILRVNGYGYIEQGNFIYVYTQGELEQIGRTESRIFELEYLSATDADEFIKPLLSEKGQSSARGDVQAGFQPSSSDGGADSYAYNVKLVVNDYPENLDKIAELLEALDTPPQQVLIEAVILQTSLDEDNAFGIDFSLIADMDFTDLNNPLSAVSDIFNGSTGVPAGFQPLDNKARALQSTVGNTGGAGGLKLGLLTDDVSVFLKVLDQVNDTKVLARPKIMVLNRQRAEVEVGRRVGFLQTTSNQNTTTQTVAFLETGINLSVRPFISKNGMIRLELSPRVSDFVLRDVLDLNENTVTIPDELTNELTTNVRVRDGQTLVLGGLFRESTTITRRQIPLLGDIPILGALFRGQEDSVDRSEIVFLITPSIVHDEILWEIGSEMLSYTDALSVGARAGLLPFGREFVTSNYNRDALKAYRAGNLSKALYYVNASLGMDPTQAEIIRLREELTGEKETAANRSLLDRAFRSKLGSKASGGVSLPREVSVLPGLGAIGLGVDAPDRWSGSPEGRWEATEPQTPSIEAAVAETDPELSQPGEPLDPGAEAIFVDPRHPRTKQIPRVSSHQRFWRAGEHPAGLDDPAWKQSSGFVTFDGMLETDGAADGGG
ncbi:MAG: hypothetical protein IH888_01735 [Planctomycetes bacterium]|nr:hypothetical protein [Planctomycetota bacterium]